MSWKAFLHSRQAILNNNIVQQFSQPVTLEQPIIADLTQQGLLCFSGEESQAFLQNQLSSDVRLLSQNNCVQYSSYSTAKGRMLASFLIWQHQQQYYLQLDPELLPSIQKRLSMYILRAKTTVIDETSRWGKFGLAGAGVRQVLNTALSITAPDDMQILAVDSTLIMSLPGERFECITPLEHASALWEKLVNAGCVEAGDPVWQLSEIRAGIPWISSATQEEFIPQMINLDHIGGVSFNKGCYPGQEIVARTHYLGKLKRRMFHAIIQSSQPVVSGMDVFSDEMNGQSSGKILNAAASHTGEYEVLVVAQISSLPYGLHLGSLDGPVLEIKTPLPYK